ncbi:MAG: hypothetical protein AB1576_12655 [Bacillota bacterium]
MQIRRGENISELEKHYLKEQLRHEKLCVAKCDNYSAQVQEPALKGLVGQVRDTCQRHVDSLANVLKRHGFQPE